MIRAGRVIRIVDVETGGWSDQRGHVGDVSGLAFTRDGQAVLSAGDGEDGTIRVWDAAPGLKKQSSHPFSPNLISTKWPSYGPALCLSPDGRHLITVYSDKEFSLWDTLRLAEGKRQSLPFANHTTIAAVAAGGKLCAFGSQTGELMLWDLVTGETRNFPRLDSHRVYRLEFSRDGRSLAAASDSDKLGEPSIAEDTIRTIRVWDVDGLTEKHTIDSVGEFPVLLNLSADAKTLMAGFSQGQVKLWPLDGQSEASTFYRHSGWVRGLGLSADGQTLVSAGGTIRFWDVKTRHENALRLNPRKGSFFGIALSHDGRRLAAGASDGRITIWDITSHQEVATLEGHKEWVAQLAFTPDGDHLVSASKDQLRVWTAASWTEIEAAEKKDGK